MKKLKKDCLRNDKHIDFPLEAIDASWTLFLDRDGTINVRLKDAYIGDWKNFEFIPHALESLAVFNQFFSRIVIVTNQQGIGKGLMTHEDLKKIHDKMLEEIQMHGGFIDQIYYCPELAIYNPPARKPNPGMAFQAKSDFPQINFSKSIMIGDTESDILFGKQLGMKTILLSSPKTTTEADLVLDALLDFATMLVS